MLDERLLRRMFEDAVERTGTFGAQLAIVKGGEQLSFAAGTANAERGTAMTADTLIQIGSITKLFNAVILATLVEDRLVDLDAPVGEHLSHLQLSRRDITLRHLLSMSSGLDNGPYFYLSTGENALADYVKHLGRLPQHFVPGEYFGYSNAGTCIAGYVAARVANKSWETLLRERILRPAGFARAAILDDDLHDEQISAGHSLLVGEGIPTVVQPKFTAVRGRAPSGPSFALTARELARFATMFLNKGLADTGAKILSESSVEDMLKPRVPTLSRKYGSAWCTGPSIGSWEGTQIFGHGGSTMTSSSYLYWMPQHHGAISLIVNTPKAMGEFSKIAFEEILYSAFGFRRPPIDQPDVSQPPLGSQRYVGTYEELGMGMRVVARGGDALEARWIPQPVPGEQGADRSERVATLTPLDRDRFLVNPAAGTDKHRGVMDAVFFGEDGYGRATNALNLVFPMSRVPVGN